MKNLICMAILTPYFAMAAVSGISVVELIYPRNGSAVNPSGLIPVVFAVQNPALASSLDTEIHWATTQEVNGSYTGSGTADSLYMRDVDAPWPIYLALDSFGIPSDTDQSWKFRWYLLTNTSQPVIDNVIFFTTNKSAPAPDLQTSNDTCTPANSNTLIPGSAQSGQANGTGIGETPTTTTCAVTIDASAASTIVARITAIACANGPVQNVTCPAETWNSEPTSSATPSATSSAVRLGGTLTVSCLITLAGLTSLLLL